MALSCVEQEDGWIEGSAGGGKTGALALFAQQIKFLIILYYKLGAHESKSDTDDFSSQLFCLYYTTIGHKGGCGCVCVCVMGRRGLCIGLSSKPKRMMMLSLAW